jgi:CHAT domain-containing protein
VGRAAQALMFAEAALRLATEAGAPMLKSRSYALLGLIYLKLDQHEEGVGNGELALAEAQFVEDEQGRANLASHAILNLGHIYRLMGNFDRALSYYDRAIETHRRMNLLIYVAEAHSGKLQSLIGLNDERAIAEEIKTSITLLEQDRLRIVEDGNRNRYFDLAQATYDIAIDFAYSRSKDTKAAFEYAEASRARSLLDLMHAGGSVIAARDGVLVRVNRLARPLSLAEIQSRLPERCRVLQYSVLDNTVISWVISKHAVATAQRAVTVAELNEGVTAFVDTITKPNERNREKDFRYRATRLYQLLIAPIKAALSPDDLLFIIPDKALNYLPFGALVCPESGRYFIEECTFEIAPSSSIMISCSERAGKRAKPADEKALAVGNPSFDHTRFPLLPDLPAAAREAEAVAALYMSSALTGRQAQVRIVKARMLEADVIHIASHHVTDERSPMESRLLLAKGEQEWNRN